MFEWLRKLFKDQENEVSIPKEVLDQMKRDSFGAESVFDKDQKSGVPTTNPSDKNNTKRIQDKPRERYIPKKRRKYRDIDNEILLLLRYCPVALSTTAIAEKVRINPVSCKSHLEKLCFDGFVERHEHGKNKKWNYWRLKR